MNSSSNVNTSPQPQSVNGFSGTISDECGEVKEDLQVLVSDVGRSVQDYCRKRPETAAAALFAIGFYLGWKVKPW